MIVISNPTAYTDEIQIIHALFDEGLELFHVRKPNFTETEMKAFLSKIKAEHTSKLVLHDYFNLAADFNIGRIHFSNKYTQVPNTPKYTKSTSSHSIEDFNILPGDFDYAFLSPVYPSISKIGYRSEINLIEAIKERSNFNTNLIALGGIDADNIQQTLENGFDDVALLGTIWNGNNPLENFKKCQQFVRS